MHTLTRRSLHEAGVAEARKVRVSSSLNRVKDELVEIIAYRNGLSQMVATHGKDVPCGGRVMQRHAESCNCRLPPARLIAPSWAQYAIAAALAHRHLATRLHPVFFWNNVFRLTKSCCAKQVHS